MTENMIPAHLIGAERRTYLAGADRARAAFRKRTGANTLQTIAERSAWHAVHGATMASKADAGGMSAVRKMHTARVTMLDTMTRGDRVGGPATGSHLETLTRQAEYAAERLAILAPVKATRKAPARKLASVPDVVVAEDVAPIVAAPATVPAPMPAMTRAARKATRRELAATMRAAGIRPEGFAWREACRAAGLFAADDVTAEVSA